MIDTVVIATDGSESVGRAVDVALDVARRFDASVHALYVLEESEVESAPEAVREDMHDALEDRGEQAVSAVAERAGVDVTTAVVEGLAEDTIVHYADDHDVDLIVMGTHGRRGLDRYLVGSVTERVVRATDVPTLVVRGTWD